MKHRCFRDEFVNLRFDCVGKPHMFWLMDGYVLWRADGSKLSNQDGKNHEMLS